jgi:hypothetical protein
LDHHNLPVVAGDCPLAADHTSPFGGYARRRPVQAGLCLVFLLSWKLFTKHIPSQSASSTSFRNELVAAPQPLPIALPRQRERRAESRLFSKLNLLVD